ncbi:PTS fructose transporter subunit IIA [Crenobacter cavernae]|uniref:PTS fructose transporter subunit IIA n=1 Tax=Crenobacter cavernae TaxID=2290923 RepID=A0A345Y5R8_9NEIS|nr:PTS fructose transporter subunit IIA [Crenobacter cavernae]
MVGVLLLCHYQLGDALIECATHVLGGPPERCAALAVGRDEDPDVVEEKARRLIDVLDAGDGVVVLTDLFGATPANVAARLAEPGHVRVAAGLNLAMLVRALCYRGLAIDDVMIKALEGARNGILDMQ